MCVCLSVWGECLREQVKKEGRKNGKYWQKSRQEAWTDSKAVTLFSGGTLTSHLSCLSLKRKEGKDGGAPPTSCSTNLMTKHYPHTR